MSNGLVVTVCIFVLKIIHDIILCQDNLLSFGYINNIVCLKGF